MSRKSMAAPMRAPTLKGPTMNLARSSALKIIAMSGLMSPSTRAFTILVKAPPMTTATARSTTLPWAMKPLKSETKDMAGSWDRRLRTA